MEEFKSSVPVELSARVCQNCSFPYKGNHCPNCGQRFLVGRFTVKESIGWIFDKMFNLEKGFFYTVKELAFNTKEMLDKYFKRATVAYMHPFRFAFLMATVSALATVFSGTFDSSSLMEFSDGFIEGWNNYEVNKAESLAQLEIAIQILEIVKKYFAFILLANIPVYALASSVLYRKRRLNFTEHLILNCYALGISLLIGLPLFLLILLDGGLVVYSVLNPIFTFLTYGYIYHKFFKENYFLSLLKTLLFYLFFGILSTIFILIGTVIYQFVYG